MTKGGQSSLLPLPVYPRKRERKKKKLQSAVRDAYATVSQARLGVSIGVQ